MDNPSPLMALACAIGNVLVDPDTPKTITDSLILWVTQLRDALPVEKSLSVYATEAEAVILAFVDPHARKRLPRVSLQESPLDGHQMTAELQSKCLDKS